MAAADPSSSLTPIPPMTRGSTPVGEEKPDTSKPKKGQRPPQPRARRRGKGDLTIVVKETDWDRIGKIILGIGMGLCVLMVILWIHSSTITDVTIRWDPVVEGEKTYWDYQVYVTDTSEGEIRNPSDFDDKLDGYAETGQSFWVENVSVRGTRWTFEDPKPGIYFFTVVYETETGWEVNEKVTPPDKNIKEGFVIQRADHSYLAYGIMLIFGPFGFFYWIRERRKSKMEAKFSDFLRDLAEYWKVGLSMSAAIDTISRGEYGALNKEVKKMAIQLSWGVAFNDVLRNFVDRIQTKLVERSVSLILEANRAGGKISDVLVTASSDAQEIKWIQTERSKGVQMYVYVIYIAFFVYLAVIAIIISVFLPSIIQASSSIISSGGGGFGGMTIRKLDRDFLLFLFFCSVLVQSVGNGLMAGVMGEGKIVSGFRHVFLMTVISWLIFGILTW